MGTSAGHRMATRFSFNFEVLVACAKTDSLLEGQMDCCTRGSRYLCRYIRVVDPE
jgi:hypothetical protein